MVKSLPAVQETQVRFRGQEHPLEKGMATLSCLENPMDRGARWAAVYGVTILVSLMAQIVRNLPAMQETQV